MGSYKFITPNNTETIIQDGVGVGGRDTIEVATRDLGWDGVAREVQKEIRPWNTKSNRRDKDMVLVARLPVGVVDHYSVHKRMDIMRDPDAMAWVLKQPEMEIFLATKATQKRGKTGPVIHEWKVGNRILGEKLDDGI